MTKTMDSTLESRIHAELEQVLDPCSTFTDNPVNIVDLGLVEEVTVEDGIAEIRLLPTNQMCMYMMNMSDEIQDRLGEFDDLNEIRVTQENGKLWTPVRMSDEARQERKQIFEERAEKHGLTPYTE